jgi:hypothetical protein
VGGRRSSPPEDAADRRRRLGAAIKLARGELSQTELGARLAPQLGIPIPQGTVSRWELGKTEMTLEQVRALERCLDLDPGHLAAAGGYLG